MGLKSNKTRVDYAVLTEQVYPEDRAARDAAIKRALETRGEYAMEYRVLLPDGTLRWIGTRGYCMDVGNSKGIRLLGVSMDVTAQKQAQERFRLVVEASPNGIVLVNAQGHIVLVNACVEKLFGYGREELVGQRVELLVPERFRGEHPAYRTGFHAAPAAREAVQEAIRDALLSGKEASGRLHYDGQMKAFFLNGQS